MLSKARNIPIYSAAHHKRDAYYVHVCQFLKSSLYSLFKVLFLLKPRNKTKTKKTPKPTSITCQHDIKQHNISEK